MVDRSRIRRATPADLPALAALEARVFPDPWSAAALAEALADIALVVERAGVAVGYALGRVAGEDGELLNLAVAPECRREGLGTRLAHALIATLVAGGATRVFLEVRESNAAARALYAGLGFTEVGRRPGYYRGPREDARVLMRPIGPGDPPA